MPTAPTTMTEDEVERIRTICKLPNNDVDVEILVQRINKLNPAQVAITREDIRAHRALGRSTLRVKGGSKGTDLSFDRDRLAIANDLRSRLGYEELTEAASVDPDEFVLGSVII